LRIFPFARQSPRRKNGQALNYTGDLSTVFSCLATNLGTLGCGEEHTLQAFEFALAAGGIGNDAQHQMLRPSAYLGLVFLSDCCRFVLNDCGLYLRLLSIWAFSVSRPIHWPQPDSFDNV